MKGRVDELEPEPFSGWPIGDSVFDYPDATVREVKGWMPETALIVAISPFFVAAVAGVVTLWIKRRSK